MALRFATRSESLLFADSAAVPLPRRRQRSMIRNASVMLSPQHVAAFMISFALMRVSRASTARSDFL